ncbi:DUF5615 family PIN-like protein [Larkinella rosea]|uniref:DUF5615 domain-containing protein n=1 Tax=Larkinella rosea TaxID=2025312 RepID=A0A3P1BMT0_9BACT|nr:DUF5615 family PIN-like protein [Larkinella rosea]RRB02096.1 hypothetical protein EHT25_16555 [Larkinella rosea]
MSSLRYLIDTNLPYYFSIWRSDQYIHQRDINSKAADTDIWAYAKANNLTIITKDRDYSDRMLLSSTPPRIIHIKTGNMKMREFYTFIDANWQLILELSETHKLVYVFRDHIEGVE